MRFVRYEGLRGMEAPVLRGPGLAAYHFDYDVLPVARQRVLAFVLVNSTLTVWEFPFERFHKGPREVWSGQWQRKGKFPALFAEPFRVAACDGAYFFVTDSGAVYMAEETRGKWQTAAIWKDAVRPVLAMLVKSDGSNVLCLR